LSPGSAQSSPEKFDRKISKRAMTKVNWDKDSPE